MFRSRSWFGGGWNRPKNRLSLDHLKYLYSVLERNPTVSDSNRGLLVESLRSIAEILIWGDQHDSSVFDFFLEKNMLSYFLHIMRQKSGGASFVCVQLLQTLNILFENIRNETSLYYLLSNNHVNSIIVHKFDFSDEDVMGYYILFLKTLSLKLNTHTIHFFYNEHTNDFPLYTEAIKFFNHPESMVRIAVRTISLNVYKVENTSMLQFIRDKTAAPYFSNLVWFIGKHILELDTCVRTDIDHQSHSRLSNLVAEHLDHLHYLNDILCLDIVHLNAVLTEHLLHKLFVPLYIFSLTPAPSLSMAVVTQNLAAVLNKVVDIDMHEMSNPRVSAVVALYLLSLVFLVITHGPLVHALAWVILNADHSVFKEGAAEVLNAYIERREAVALGFEQPRESLEEALDTVVGLSSSSAENRSLGGESSSGSSSRDTSQTRSLSDHLEKVNITDEEKEKLRQLEDTTTMTTTSSRSRDTNRPFFDMVLVSLDCTENDYIALLALCLIYAFANNKGVSPEWLEQVLNKPAKSSIKYNTVLIERLLHIISLASQPSCRIRLVTLEIALSSLLRFAKTSSGDFILSETQQTVLFSARNQAMAVLRSFYKSEDIFLDLFENEFNEMCKSTLNVEFLCMDSTILLPPTGTPLTGINFARRLPCGEVEKARRAIRVFFLLRRICQEYLGEVETLLPLTNLNACVQVENILDLNNSDLIGCTVVTKDVTKFRRFLVIDTLQLILVEPDPKRLGWGISKFVGFLQDVEVIGDKDDSRCLHITVHRGGVSNNRTPILSAKFLFDDHIRCMAAKQRLTKGRSKARQKKMYQIAQLLEIPGQMVEPPIYPISGIRTPSTSRLPREHRPLFSTANRVPGFAAALRRESMPSGSVSRVQMAPNRSIEGIRNENIQQRRRRSSNTSSASSSNGSLTARERSPGNRSPRRQESPRESSSRSRDSSPRVPRPRSEEIPLEDFQHSRNSSPISRGSSSNTPSRSHTPSRIVCDPISISPRNGGVVINDMMSSLTPNGVGGMIVKETTTNSEETSFIARDGKEKRRGGVETV